MKLKIYKQKDRNTWYARVFIPKQFSKSKTKQEVYKSSGKTDFKEAKKYLEDWFIDLQYEIKHGKFVGNIPILNLIHKFTDHITNEYELKRVSKIYFENFINKIKPVIRFIEIQKVKVFRRKTLKIDYVNFRRNEKTNIGNSSIRLEMNALRLVLNYALDQELITKSDLPIYPSFPKEDNKRTFLRLEDYKKLLKISRQRINDATVSGDDTSFYRTRLHYWIIFSVGSGLRVSETERLTFGDIEVVTVDGEKTLKIMVKDGKTGTRSVLTESSSYHAIIKLKELYLKRGLKIDKNTNVFQTKTFSGALRRLLISCGLRTCKRTGKIIDGKSWRQTYISWEVIKGKRSLLWIANNCGNSVSVIQSNYANNLQHEDFFEEKLNAISII